MSDEKGKEAVAFPKEEHRELMAELRRAESRRGHIVTELDGIERKVAGLVDKLDNARKMQADKEKILGDELKGLDAAIDDIKAREIEMKAAHKAQ